MVSKGREILERSIHLVNSHPTWAAKVVYGDTDSLFVHLPGRSRSQAFTIGQEIAATITKMYPKPIKLKFEKVYLPCLLQVRVRERVNFTEFQILKTKVSQSISRCYNSHCFTHFYVKRERRDQVHMPTKNNRERERENVGKELHSVALVL